MRSASIRFLCETCIIKYGVLLYPARGETFVDLVREEARCRGRRHELAMDLGRNSAVLDQPSVAELDLQSLRLRIVADRADLARVDALSLHDHSTVTLIVSPLRTEANWRGSPSIRPSTLQGLTSFGSAPSDIGVRPQGRARAVPSVQKHTVPGGTTCFAPRSSATFTGISK